MTDRLPVDWALPLAAATRAPSYASLMSFLEGERAHQQVLPRPEHVFAAFEATPFSAVSVVLLGQDPYPTPGHAHGLCFSVMPGVMLPRSLSNIYKELQTDLGIEPVTTGYLMNWARQGILMLNTVLTVRAGHANSHRGKGWEPFTDAVIKAVNDRVDPAVFVFWGKPAQKKRSLIDETRHVVVAGAHPSPLSAKQWFGSKPFSQVNAGLQRLGRKPIDWRITG